MGGAEWATRLKSATLYRIIAALLVVTAGVLWSTHDAVAGSPAFTGHVFVVACFVTGFVIGVIASLLGVAGGEFLIPALVLICGIDIKVAGSLSLAISLPTMLVGFARYSRDQSFSVLRQNWDFFVVMAAGSMLGTFMGGLWLGIAPAGMLLPLLVALLLLSAVKVWRHEYPFGFRAGFRNSPPSARFWTKQARRRANCAGCAGLTVTPCEGASLTKGQ